MKIEHAAMYVNNLEAARDFFVNYLGGKANDGYKNKTTDFRSYFISFDGGARLEIMNKPQLDDAEKSANRTGYAHLAFSAGSKDAVDKLTEKKRESFIDKQVDMQVVTNFNKLLGAISDYMVFKFDEDDYTTAYYNYKRYTILINMNMEILEKRKEYVEKNLKTKGQKKSK